MGLTLPAPSPASAGAAAGVGAGEVAARAAVGFEARVGGLEARDERIDFGVRNVGGSEHRDQRTYCFGGADVGEDATERCPRPELRPS